MSPNAARNAEIISLRKRGWGHSEIAGQLGLTRTTVIGVCFRAGLCDPASPKSIKVARTRAPYKLSDGDVSDIRRDYAAGRGATDLSRLYGVHRNTIHSIVAGRLRTAPTKAA